MSLHCGELDERTCLSAYALIEAAGLAISAEEWMREVSALLDPETRSGIVGCRAPSGYLGGLFTYWVGAMSWRPSTLEVRRFLAFDLLVPSGAKALLDAVDHLARQNRCPVIDLEVAARANNLLAPSPMGSLRPSANDALPNLTVDLLRAAGYSLAGLSFRRHLEPNALAGA